MRSIAWRVAAPLLLAGAACGRESSDRQAMNADLQRDLAAASAVGVGLANGAQGYRNGSAGVVSAIEQSERAIPIQRRPTPRPVVRNRTESQPENEKAPEPIPDVKVDAPQAPEPQQTEAAASDAPTVPVVAPRPAPLPVDYPAQEGGSRGSGNGSEGVGSGPDLGTVIGVILRGGAGDDHCVPRRPRSRPRGTGFPIPPIFNNPGVLMPTTGGARPSTRPRVRF